MTGTIDRGGRVVIPKAIRDRLGLTPGSQVEILEQDGFVEIASVRTPMPITEVEPVALTDREMPVLTAELVRRTIDSIRR